ncbi:MAG: hypothetical protein IKO93_10640 [Lentisphaeria bacterium]|nr:hypothetical protein [Lentisphaeria bacterium]
MKRDNSGRSIALLLAERFDAGPEKAELLNFEKDVKFPVFSDRVEFFEILFKTYATIFSAKSEADEDFIWNIVEIMGPAIWKIRKLYFPYEIFMSHTQKLCQTVFSEKINNIDTDVRRSLCFSIGVELLYGHLETLEDWDQLQKLTLEYIPEAYRGIADGILSEMKRKKDAGFFALGK